MADPNPLRRRLQYPALAGAVALLASATRWPAAMLPVVWNVIVPVLPASFMVTPHLWRAICPLATAGLLTNGLVARRALSSDGSRRSAVVGLVLLATLIPFRHLSLNQSPVAFLLAVGLLLAASALLGAVFDVKAGFCNAFCPILPVERLYGQLPVIEVGDVRCVPCTACTRNGCLDLGTGSIGAGRGGRRPLEWLFTPSGLFLTAFPGLIIGYGRTGDVPLAQAGTLYLQVGLWILASWLALSLLSFAAGLALAQAAPIGAALSLTLYYWFAAPKTAQTLGGGVVLADAIRLGGAALAAWWLWRAYQSRPSLLPFRLGLPS
jgi:hypothetical protein